MTMVIIVMVMALVVVAAHLMMMARLSPTLPTVTFQLMVEIAGHCGDEDVMMMMMMRFLLQGKYACAYV